MMSCGGDSPTAVPETDRHPQSASVPIEQDGPDAERPGPTPGSKTGKAVEVPKKAGNAPPELLGDEPRLSSQNAYDLLDELRSLDLGEGDELGGEAEELLRQLGAQGARSVLPIRDLLLDSRGTNDIPQALREALLDVLVGLNSPEVEPAALELLTANPEPFEIWRLGQYLELTHPGRYSDSIRLAAEQALITADPQSFIPPEFYELLGIVGNADTAIVLAEAPLEQQAYAGLALAALPDGEGVSALERQASVFETGRDTLEGRFALQLLAQEAPRSPQAGAALVRLAETGSIPRDIWPYVLDLVAGNWVLSMNKPLPELLVGSHTYYGVAGNQVIWRVAPQPGEAIDGFEERRVYLLDQLQPFAPADLAWDP